MTATQRRALLVGGAICLLCSFLLPAVSAGGQRLSGAELMYQAAASGRPLALAFAANLMLPFLALRPLRWRQLQWALVVGVLALAAWLTARAWVGPANLHSGVLLWWLAMIAFACVALTRHRAQ